MKQNPEFLLREVADRLVLVPVGAVAVKFPGMVTMNKTSKFLWEQLAKDRTPEELVSALTQRYDVQPEKAAEDVDNYLKRLRSIGAVIE